MTPDYALAQARALDELRLSGRPIGPLHGIPVGIKDIFDTADMPTKWVGALRGTHTFARRHGRITASGGRRRDHGQNRYHGICLFLARKDTQPAQSWAHPRRLVQRFSSRSGGKHGSTGARQPKQWFTFRSAAYCGVIGFKPTHGLISRHGALALSRTLDHVGVFANSVEDIALLAEQIVGYDENDPDTRPRARPPFVDVAAEEPPLAPMFAFIKTPHWESANEDTREGFAEINGALDNQVEEVELFPSAGDAWEWHQSIMSAEMAYNLEREWRTGGALLSEQLRSQIERGREVRATDYLSALGRIKSVNDNFIELFEQRYDEFSLLPHPAPRRKVLPAPGIHRSARSGLFAVCLR